ncbi:MAG: radical SAM protein [Candidatus Nanoarchaeia archaeon]|nr:radical SAM protein [Candidatus Jingweiarchaeum tengchongense]
MDEIVPRYAVIFIQRHCPRNCVYCRSRNVVPKRLLPPEEWIEAFDILQRNGVEFFLILGNEILLYPEIVHFVRMLKENGFYGKYAMYSTFIEPQYTLLREKLVDAGLYNISAGIDIVEGYRTGDASIDEKSLWGIEQLKWFKEHGVPDLQGTITIHEKNYRIMHEIVECLSRNGIWAGASLLEYSLDGKHDFYGGIETVKELLIRDPIEFRKYMEWFAEGVEDGKWKMQLPPEYFRELGKHGGVPHALHCRLPLNISIEADGEIRLCGYRPFYRNRGHTVFEIGNKIDITDYTKMYYEEAPECPGCSWGMWYMSEHWYRLDKKFGDDVFQKHASKYWRG